MKTPTQHYAGALEEYLEVMKSPAGALAQLWTVASAEKTLEAMKRELVQEARREGCTWEMIGRELGISKQAVQQRYGS
jgi:hypothetical protein